MNPMLASVLHTESASLFSGLRTETGSLLLLGLALFGLASLTRRLFSPAYPALGAKSGSSGEPNLPAAA